MIYDKIINMNTWKKRVVKISQCFKMLKSLLSMKGYKIQEMLYLIIVVYMV